MTSLSDYENSLDTLDTQLFSTATGIQCNFGGGYFFPYKSLSTFEVALSIARDLSLVFLEEKVHASYLAKRFLRLANTKSRASRVSGPKLFPQFFNHPIFVSNEEKGDVDVDSIFRKHEFHHLTVEGTKNISIGRNDSELQICFLGLQPHFFLRFSKSMISTKSDQKVPIRIERPASYNWNFVQSISTSDLEITLLTEQIVFDLPTTHTWVDASDGKLQNWPLHEAMRILITHNLSESEVQSVVSELKDVFSGLSLKVRSIDAVRERFNSFKLGK